MRGRSLHVRPLFVVGLIASAMAATLALGSSPSAVAGNPHPSCNSPTSGVVSCHFSGSFADDDFCGTGQTVDVEFDGRFTVPLDPNRYLFEAWAAMAALGAGCFEEAVTHAQASTRLHALHTPSLRLLVAALWLAERHEDARVAAARYMKTQPGARVGPQRPPLPGRQPVFTRPIE